MGFLPYNFLETVVSSPITFIETGTYKGGQVQHFLENNSLPNFNKIYTIELGEQNCRIASRRFLLYEQHNCDITKFDRDTDEEDFSFNKRKEFFNGKLVLIQGNSSIELHNILSEINELCVFWLDAHSGKELYARGNIDVPLYEELDVIGSHHIKNHSIFIDDFDKFGTIERLCDWTHIQPDIIAQKLNQINPNYNVRVESPIRMPMLVATVDTSFTIPGTFSQIIY